jgi:hypothetical protein
MALLPDGETLSHFDQAYYDKAERALEIGEDDDDGRSVGSRSLRSIKSVVPKLPPPRFVPREQVCCEHESGAEDAHSAYWRQFLTYSRHIC